MSIRTAQLSDLDGITWVSVAATPADPVCPYRYPHREQYPEDFERFSRIRLGEFLAEASTGSTVFMVYEAPSIEDPSIRKVISYAIWELPKGIVARPETRALTDAGQQSGKKPKDRFERRDANPARLAAYRADISVAKKAMFDDKYGADKYIYLSLLNTHPNYQGQGAGKALCQWGLEKAKREGWSVTLFPSPMGKRLYGKLGFRDVGSFKTQVEGEAEWLDTPAMVLEGSSS